MPHNRPVRLTYLVSHPIQYQAPLLRRISNEPGIDLRVLFMSDISVRSYNDPGFKVNVTWDVPLLDGYRYDFLPKRDNGPPDHFRWPRNYALRKYFLWDDVDVLWVHGYHTSTLLWAMLNAKLRRIPVLARSDNWSESVVRGPGWRRQAKDKIVSSVLKAPSAFLAVGSENASYYRSLGVAGHKIFLLPYAVDNERFRCQALQAGRERELFRAGLGLDPGRPVILFAGKLQKRKRAADLVQAFTCLWRNGSARRPYLVIVGDGEERTSLESAIAASGVQEHIRLIGFKNQTELPQYYDLCDVFVLPSSREPWGLVLNEVMCASRALIVSNEVGAASDLVQDGANGYVFAAGDVAALAESLAKVLATPEGARKMGQKSWDIVQDFDFESNVQGLKDALSFVGRPVALEREPAVVM